MKLFISKLLLISVIVANLAALSACSSRTGSPNGGTEKPDGTSDDTTIRVPDYKDYQRRTVDFDKMTYIRPDLAAVTSAFDEVTRKIELNENADYDHQIELIRSLEDEYENVSTMGAYANLRFQENSADEYWSEENEHISTGYPDFSGAVERLFVAAANSPHAEKFEELYFGDGLIEKYRGGGKYTDTVIALMKEEADLESDYSSLSTATVTVSFGEKVDTVEGILAYYRDLYGDNSIKYRDIERATLALYEQELERRSSDILVELFKLRRRIADELGYESYAEFAYENIYHDYSPDDFLAFADGIDDYVLPVYLNLSNYLFNQIDLSGGKGLSTPILVNRVADMLKSADAELYDAYSFMLQHKLFNIDTPQSGRFDGAFTTYLDAYDAPFIFITTEGNAVDYTTLCHEFGHFYDYFVNASDQASLDASEISSQALEFLALTKFHGILPDKTAEELSLYLIENALSCILFQGFYATFEHIAYSIPYESISLGTLTSAAKQAARETGLNPDMITDLSYVSIPHIFLYPFYVQSYCTSASVALEIYFTEIDSAGDGFDAYKMLVNRGEEKMSFEESLENASLTSPFDTGYLRKLADDVHYRLLGYHYFKNNFGQNAA